jgi:hypothetical protein
VKNSLSLQGVLNRCLSVPEHTREIDPQAESRSYAHLVTDIKRSDQTVDFPSYVMDFFAVILEYQEDLQRMEPDEEAFYRTLLHDTYPLRLQLPQYHKGSSLYSSDIAVDEMYLRILRESVAGDYSDADREQMADKFRQVVRSIVGLFERKYFS